VTTHATLTAADFLGLFGHFLLLSLLSVGGAISAAGDMHRYLVVEHGWLNDADFTTSIALAQAAPGPNVLFVAVLGWNAAGPPGALVAITVYVMLRTRWSPMWLVGLGAVVGALGWA